MNMMIAPAAIHQIPRQILLHLPRRLKQNATLPQNQYSPNLLLILLQKRLSLI